jgi:DNA-binding transcriptional regulator PaaX
MYVVARNGKGLTSAKVLREVGHGASTIRQALISMVNSEILRDHLSGRQIQYCFEDPFFDHWIRITAMR